MVVDYSKTGVVIDPSNIIVDATDEELKKKLLGEVNYSYVSVDEGRRCVFTIFKCMLFVLLVTSVLVYTDGKGEFFYFTMIVLLLLCASLVFTVTVTILSQRNKLYKRIKSLNTFEIDSLATITEAEETDSYGLIQLVVGLNCKSIYGCELVDMCCGEYELHFTVLEYATGKYLDCVVAVYDDDTEIEKLVVTDFGVLCNLDYYFGGKNIGY